MMNNDHSRWVGNKQESASVIDQQQADKMAVTLGEPPLAVGEPLPLCWQWAWFNEALPKEQVGRDGHPKKGLFLPDLGLPRRMWAGGKIELLYPILIGEEIVKRSTIQNIEEKTGKSGKLAIVSVLHDYCCKNDIRIRETQNLVYREDPVEGASSATPNIEPPTEPELTETLNPNPVLMFRYSALTFNGHRIHYDADYAREVERYPGLVFHAPLTATKLCALGQKLIGDQNVKTFEYRATAPLFAGQDFAIRAKKSNKKIVAWAETPSGGQAIIATMA